MPLVKEQVIDRALVTVQPTDVDDCTLEPSRRLVRSICERLVRSGNPSIPGFALIPDTRAFCKTRTRSTQFQNTVTAAVMRHLNRLHPRLLRCPPFLSLPKSAAAEYYSRAILRIQDQVRMRGLNTFRPFHMDLRNHLYISFCYGPFRNVEGGIPRILDLLHAERKLGKSATASLRQTISKHNSNFWYIYHPRETFTILSSNARADLTPWIIELKGLEFHRYPLLIMSNRMEDGLMHGATEVRIREAHKSSARSITYRAVSLFLPACE